MSDDDDFAGRGRNTRDEVLALWKDSAELRLLACDACGERVFMPRTRCPRCWHGALRPLNSQGYGHVLSHAAVHKGLSEPFASQAPIVIAEIELDEGVRLIARVVGHGSTGIATNARVRLADRSAAASYDLPTFELV